MEPPPELAAGDDYPGASWFASLRRYLLSLRLTVAKGSGLTLVPGPAGQVLGLDRGALPRYAKTTSTFVGANNTTGELATGTVALYRVTVNAQTGKAFRVPVGGPNVQALSGDPAGVASGRWVQVKVIDDTLNIDVDWCS